jgi:hypothetical protein
LPAPPDNPYVIVEAINNGTYSRDLDLNRDRQVDNEDLEIAVAQFGGATIDDFLGAPGAERDTYPSPVEPPHMLDAPIICGRCHSMDGLPGGMETDWGQENLCLSCHSGAARAMAMPTAGAGHGNSHAWGVPATSGGVAGPDPNDVYELALHLDNGDIRCGTCHDPHELGTNWCEDGPNDGNECVDETGCPDGTCVPGGGYFRDPRPGAALCKQCHRGTGAPTDHAVGTEHGPEYCTDCHDMHALGDKPSLLKESMYSWYNGGMVEVGFADDTIGVGDGGFVDPDAGEYGLCDVAHWPPASTSLTPPVGCATRSPTRIGAARCTRWPGRTWRTSPARELTRNACRAIPWGTSSPAVFRISLTPPNSPACSVRAATARARITPTSRR